MRLLNIENLQLETFYGSDVPEYAALSHTWGDDEVDTCCIDKSSSAELSEAINSMFRWYQESKVCFAYLEDVSREPKRKIIEVESNFKPVPSPCAPLSTCELLPKSRWFKRGWTLQELIAPKMVYFYDSTWKKIGEERDLQKEISKITGIDLDVLHDHTLLPTKSIAQRMSWASKRETTRTEDIAYCLMGIFNVNMPLLYGEGGRAFIRLQEEIMRSTNDHSLFAWNYNFPNTLFGTSYVLENDSLLGVGALAPHPVAFSSSTNIIPRITNTEPYFMTNKGLQIHLSILGFIPDYPPQNSIETFLAMLECEHMNDPSIAIAIPLFSISKRNFCRPAGQDFVQLEYSTYKKKKVQYHHKVQQVYLLGAGPQLRSRWPEDNHRCWLREFGEDQGLRFHEARYCEYPIKSQGGDHAFHFWNYKNKSVSWDKNWNGVRAAVYLSKRDGPSFAIILTFELSYIRTAYYKCVEIMQLSPKSIEEPIHQRLDQILLGGKNTPPNYMERPTATVTSEDGIIIAKLEEEFMFGNLTHVLDIYVK